MSKKTINQNTNYVTQLLNSIESNFIFDENPVNRLENTAENIEKVKNTCKDLTNLSTMINFYL